MAIKNVEPKCFILALFIRNDGARFLLGSGAYEFKDSQQHFAANTMENDVVSVQGNDGYLLAGQVRRPGVQSFDGYVGDSSTSKTAVESLRREFFQFFRKGYFYKVVYVFPDGSAIQRKRGFIVDAPAVQELYQIYPEYHVALNFEDINYYFYDENAEGEEIYGKSATIGLSMASGGLIWDANGAVVEPLTFTGVVTVKDAAQINNLLSVPAPLESVSLNGDTYQQTYSGIQLLTKDGYATSFTDTGFWVGLTSNTINEDLGYGWGRWTSTQNTRWVNIFPRMQGAIKDGTYKPDTTYTILIQWKNVINFKSLNISQSNNGENPFSTDVTTFDLGSMGGTAQAIVQTKSTITSDMYALRSFLTKTSASETARIDLRVTIVEGSYSNLNWQPYVGGAPSPNPDYPQEVQTVTGEQTIRISSKAGASHTYPISLGSIELCKIGDYQDYIYKSGGAWYVHKEVGLANISSSDLSSFNTHSGTHTTVNYNNGSVKKLNSAEEISVKSSNFVGVNNRQTWGGSALNSVSQAHNGNYLQFALPNSAGTTYAEVQSYFQSHPTSVYYALATPTDTQITDTTLIGQLNILNSTKLYVGENSLRVTTGGNNQSVKLDITYYTQLENGYGFIWEEGRVPSYNVAIDSVDSVYPVLTITGETIEPIITNVTTGTMLKYNGTVAASQTLVIDMMSQTATLNGTSVIGNITGDWLYFSPGNNRVEYTATNANAPDATIEWQEIIG